MPATVLFYVYHGAAPGSATDVTSTTVRYKRADNDTQDATDPVPIPTAGTNYSWRKSFRIYATVGPDNDLSNLRVHSEQQNLGTDRELLVATAASYTQGSSADESSPISAVDVDTYTSGSPLVVQAGQVLGAAATGVGSQNFLVLQASIGTSAVQGNSAAAKGIVYRWDES